MQYSKILQPANFVLQSDGKYKVTINAGLIEFNTDYFSIIKVVRKENANAPWRNVIFQYEIDDDGNLYLYFDEAFTGCVAMITDEADTV